MSIEKILVSECLCAERICRYDGKAAPLCEPIFLRWKAEGRLASVCPEVFGGLSVPRDPAERKDGGVVTRTGADVTEAFVRGAEEALRLARERRVAFCILKDGSPSCGVRQIYDGTFSEKKISGQGIAAETLKAAGFTIFSEKEIAEAAALLEKLENQKRAD